MKLFENITQTPQTVYTGGSTLGDQVTVYPGSTIKVNTKEEEDYLRRTHKFQERKISENIEDKNLDKKKFKS